MKKVSMILVALGFATAITVNAQQTPSNSADTTSSHWNRSRSETKSSESYRKDQSGMTKKRQYNSSTRTTDTLSNTSTGRPQHSDSLYNQSGQHQPNNSASPTGAGNSETGSRRSGTSGTGTSETGTSGTGTGTTGTDSGTGTTKTPGNQ